MAVVDMDGWTRVADAEGKALGWMAAPDPDEPDVDYFEADRSPKIRRRAAAVGEVTALLGEYCLDVDGVFDAARAAGVSEAALDSAGYLAVELMKIESLRA